MNGTTTPFRSANVRRFVVGLLCSEIAYQVQAIAVAWHVYGLRHRPFDLGLVGLALFLPTFVFALPAGVFSDRHERRAIVVATAIVEAALVAAFACVAWAGVRELAPYLAILAAIGTTRAFGVPAERALLPSIVAPEAFARAQAAFASLRQLVIVGGPALGGALVALGTEVALATSVAGIVASAFLLARLRVRPHASEATARPPSLHDALAGLRFLRAHPILAGSISLDLFAVLFGGATALLPAFADGIFHIGPAGLGLLRSAPAAGGAVVAAILARRPLERHVGRTLLVTVAVFGAATIAFGLSRDVRLSLACLAVVGGSDMVSVVIRSGLVALRTPDDMRGRVNAVENVFIGASNELGEFESGTLAAFVGVVPAVVVGGIGTLVVIALWGSFNRALRDADRFVDSTAESASVPAASGFV